MSFFVPKYFKEAAIVKQKYCLIILYNCFQSKNRKTYVQAVYISLAAVCAGLQNRVKSLKVHVRKNKGEFGEYHIRYLAFFWLIKRPKPGSGKDNDRRESSSLSLPLVA